MQNHFDAALITRLVAALEQTDLYLNAYDTSAPSRIKATTRAEVEDALAAAREAIRQASGTCGAVGTRYRVCGAIPGHFGAHNFVPRTVRED